MTSSASRRLDSRYLWNKFLKVSIVPKFTTFKEEEEEKEAEDRDTEIGASLNYSVLQIFTSVRTRQKSGRQPTRKLKTPDLLD